MKFLIDENTPIQYVGVLKFVLGRHHTVDHVSDLQWRSKKDLALLADAHRRGYQVFITNDRNQLNDPTETKAILRSGMHHVLYPRAGVGLPAQAYALASVTAALPAIVKTTEGAVEQLLITVRGISRNAAERVKVTPAREATYSRTR